MAEMKILFIEPPYRSTIEQLLGVHGPLLGFGSMAYQLEEEGHDVEILDCPTLGLTFSDLKRLMSDREPDVVGITSTTPSFSEACRVAEMVKNLKTECTVIMGGPHVSFEDISAIENSSVDIVVRGEGEITMRELIATLCSGEPLSSVSGITYKQGGMSKRNPGRPFIDDLDSLSVSYQKLPMDQYRFQGDKFATILTSRGCPFGCIYCSSSTLHGKKWRCQSSDRVLKEIRLLVDNYGTRQIEFLDDLFTFDNGPR